VEVEEAAVEVMKRVVKSGDVSDDERKRLISRTQRIARVDFGCDGLAPDAA
jgi:hypothetical protein